MIGRPFLRLGRPSLLQTAARTAVVAGTATAVTGGMMRRRARMDQQEAEASAYRDQVTANAVSPTPTAEASNLIEQLQELGKLRDDGVLTEEEFASQKARLLNQ